MRLPTSRRTARFVGLVPSQLMAAPGLADGRCCCSAACGTLALLPLLSRRPPSLCVLASRRSELASSAPRWGEAVVEHEHTLHVEALGDVRHELVRGRRKGAVAVEELPTIRPGLSRAQQWSRVRWACTHQRVLGLEAQGFAQQCCHSLERSVGRDLELGRPQDGRVARVLEVDDHLPVLDGRGGRRHRSRSRRPPAARSASLSSLLPLVWRQVSSYAQETVPSFEPHGRRRRASFTGHRLREGRWQRRRLVRRSVVGSPSKVRGRPVSCCHAAAAIREHCALPPSSAP